mgnify:CR=1 FL=1|jgi:hypothetical protein
MKVKESVKKTSRFIYVIIFVTVSAFTFILPRTDRSLFGDFSYDFLKETVFTVAYFKVCKARGVGCAPTFIDGVYALREVNIYGLTISAESYRTKHYLKFLKVKDPNWREKSRALNKWNESTLDKYYKPSTLVKRGLNTTNTILNYFLFLISIPLIWYTRNLSILFVNLIKGSWKKV